MEAELQKIRDARQATFWLPVKAWLMGGVALVLAFALPPLVLILAPLFYYLMFVRIRNTARLPCPRCHKAFGSESRFPLGYGGLTCQNCGLHLYAKEGDSERW